MAESHTIGSILAMSSKLLLLLYIKSPQVFSTGMLNKSPKLLAYTISLSNRCSTGTFVPTTSSQAACFQEWLSIFRGCFELRCFQLLSTAAWLPSNALSDNWYTRGYDATFLSYSWQLSLRQPTTPTDRIQTGSHRS